MALRVTTYNCRSVKSSIEEVKFLCGVSDIVFLQETWLTPNEIGVLHSIHPDFNAIGTSAMSEAVQQGMICGRPYGGLGILWRKSLSVKPVFYDDPRLLAVELNCVNSCTVLLLNVYLPYNADSASFDIYCEYLAKIESICGMHESVYTAAIGDFNADLKSTFGKELLTFADEHDFVVADVCLLGKDSDTYTYLSEAHDTCSWLDHCLVSASLYNSIRAIKVMYDVSLADHFPVHMELNLNNMIKCDSDLNGCRGNAAPNWSNAGKSHLDDYYNLSQDMLSKLPVPSDLSKPDCVDQLYNSIVQILSCAASKTIPMKSKGKGFKAVPGWNEVAKESHQLARDAFSLWRSNDKPRQGPIYEMMRKTRAHFKYSLRQCKRDEEMHRASAMAKNLVNNDSRKFWHNAKSGTSVSALPTMVGSVVGHNNIAEMWKDYFKDIFNGVHNDAHKEYVLNYLCSDEPSGVVSDSQVAIAIGKLSINKATGADGIDAEHLRYAGPMLSYLLAICFNAMFKLGHLPHGLMLTTLLPVLKNKMGDVSDTGNYRPIAVSTMFSKVLERLLLVFMEEYLYTTDNQFGFKAHSSTDMAIFTLKQIVAYYHNYSSPLFICFLDASKAFDRVNHWTLFREMINRKIPVFIVRILVFWYREQLLNVRWGSVLSSSFTVSNGVKQGGILSPLLFNCYMDGLSALLRECNAGCYIENVAMNHLLYADDLCLISPSPNGLRMMLTICEQYALHHDIVYNVKKSLCMLIQSPKVKFSSTPSMYINDKELNYVDTYRYLGCIISSDRSDGPDLDRQRRALYVSANRIKRQFCICNTEVKTLLFNALCGNMYCSHLWARSTKDSLNRVRVAYNNALRIIFNYDRYCSAGSMFVYHGIYSFNAMLRRNIAGFRDRAQNSNNALLVVLTRTPLLYTFDIGKSWIEKLYL